MKKNIVVIGGGTGLSSMMAGLKHLKDADLCAIITVADDGGSTGRIRDVYNIPAMGDIRHVLCAMGGDSKDPLFEELMNFRFSGSEDVGGHQLGNLIFLALMDITGSFMGAVQAISKVLNVKGTILPSTLDNAILYAIMEDGTLVRGEKNIPHIDNSISRVFYRQDIHPYSKAIEAISKADLIIFGTGSLYTSILPNVIIDEIEKAIEENPCPKVYFCNAMSQPGETDGYSVEDHVRALECHTREGLLDAVIVNKKALDEKTRIRYEKLKSYPVLTKEKEHHYAILNRDLIKLDDQGRIRHDPKAVTAVVQELMDRLESDRILG